MFIAYPGKKGDHTMLFHEPRDLTSRPVPRARRRAPLYLSLHAGGGDGGALRVRDSPVGKTAAAKARVTPAPKDDKKDAALCQRAQILSAGGGESKGGGGGCG